jgi:endonuclease YncB( thermonuclease family)
MLKRATALVPLLAMLAGVLTLLTPATAQAADKNCSDFATQKAAQIFYLNAGGPAIDPNNLDGSDNDGIVCESNPCPCYYATSTPAKPVAKPAPKRIKQYARVIRVIDGDTVDVRLHSGAKRRVRLIGIDTPEVYGGVECGGRAASRSAKRLLPRRTRVILLSDPTQDDQDRYDRLLRYVIKKKGHRDINRTQVRRGHARVYVYGGDPFQRVSSYRKAQRSAKHHDRGLWNHCR